MILYAVTLYTGTDPLQSHERFYCETKLEAEHRAAAVKVPAGYAVVVTSVDVGRADRALLAQLNDPSWVYGRPQEVLK